MNDNYWDFKYVHYAIEGYQSAQELKMACNICLSTWTSPNLPWKQSGNQYGTEPSPEKDLGYSFSTKQVSCPDCLKWMERELCFCPNCKEELAHNDWCGKCADHWANELICECGHPKEMHDKRREDEEILPSPHYIYNGVADNCITSKTCLCLEYRGLMTRKEQWEKKLITARQPTLWDRIKTFIRI